ncbi:hypothetical protein [Tahibacter sp.]|uniref:hypothetical protein n=1 Tax=Tahibacter sp. TaxID=2056211 RepID=UPI0028C3CB24|nr:hypothetical protein [Tahibacter sp.]
MKNITMLVVASMAAVFGGQVAAQTCASPLPLISSAAISGDTCTATNSLPSYGGTTSAQNEIVYSFVAGPTPPGFGPMVIGQTGGFVATAAVVFLLPACTASTDPIAFGFPGSPMNLDATGMTPGQRYYVVVTADPGGPNTGCGQFSLVYGYLPVSLQKFSVD